MQYIAGISISLFLVALLLNKRQKSQSDSILLIWMIVNALNLSLQMANSNGVMSEYPILFGIVAPIPMLHGMCLYFYVAAVTNQFPKNKVRILLHLIPPLLSYLYLLRYYIFLPHLEQLALFESKGAGHETFMLVHFIAVALSGTGYIIWSILLLRKHRKNILDRFSSVEKINLRWLQFLIYGLAIVWSIVIFSQNDDYIYAAVVVFIILTGFFGVQQIDIFKKRKEQPIVESEPKAPNHESKYAKSGLSEDRSVALYEKLLTLIETEEVYKQQELSIGDLAEMLETHPNYLSQVINVKTGKSFYEYINTFRIENFKQKVAEPSNRKFTLLSLAYDCGFNSKSSFNRYFKKTTGLTPTQYLKQLS